MRIHKVLSDNGIASRRKAEEMIQKGRVSVNGHKAIIGQDINPIKDIIAIDGQRVGLRANTEKHYIALYKPRGWVTTMSDELGRKCIAQFVEDMPGKVYPIGRLDKDSEGLLLLTNDGDFANLIMHPRHHISKTYRVTVRPDITEEQLIALSTGVEIDTGKTAPAQVMVVTKEAGRVVLRMTITEGKNRQIRKMCEAVGLEVARLRRTTIGPIQLGMLQPGEWRELSATEVGSIRNAVKLEASKPNPDKKKRNYAQFKAGAGGKSAPKAGGKSAPRSNSPRRSAPKN